jgi:hypothetical protein
VGNNQESRVMSGGRSKRGSGYKHEQTFLFEAWMAFVLCMALSVGDVAVDSESVGMLGRESGGGEREGKLAMICT